MVRVAILGATGYTGGDLLRILAHHPEASLSFATTTSKPGVPISDVHPDLRGVVDAKLAAFDAATVAAGSDIVFSCLPHTESQKAVAQLMKHNAKLRVIDFSADFRFSRASDFEAAYGVPHEAPELLKQTAYGLPELFRTSIKKARIVANPGCYPTATLVPLAPLARSGLLDGPVIVDAKSGVTGAGANPSRETHFPEANESVRAYKAFQHRHQPEMEEQILATSGHTVDVRFVPHLVPMNRGILSTIYARVAKPKTAEEVHTLLSKAYEHEPFVRLLPLGAQPDTKHTTGTNFVDIGVAADAKNRLVCLTSALDNLMKGASSQAVQNLNLLCGFPETTGLKAVVKLAAKEVMA
ncbi:MAG TPA: N-acetyl-gamma-glutamyl-phosphate reductase [Candidatus Thermoplasmatota archaeon]|nr:N-acetyl-gamma-glutamyl-phosphate reductase [Candidatus Thermoplasmatota archaeon]